MSPSKPVARVGRGATPAETSAELAAGRRTIAMRHRARGRLLLGAGRAAPVHGVSPEQRARCRSSTGSSARRAGSSSASPTEDERLGAVHRDARAARGVSRRAALPRRASDGRSLLCTSAANPFSINATNSRAIAASRATSARRFAPSASLGSSTRSRTRSRKPTTSRRASRAVIRAMCEAQSWTAGNFWSVDSQRDTLWHEVGWNCGRRGSPLGAEPRRPTAELAEPWPRLDRRRDSRSAHVASRARRGRRAGTRAS